VDVKTRLVERWRRSGLSPLAFWSLLPATKANIFANAINWEPPYRVTFATLGPTGALSRALAILLILTREELKDILPLPWGVIGALPMDGHVRLFFDSIRGPPDRPIGWLRGSVLTPRAAEAMMRANGYSVKWIRRMRRIFWRLRRPV